MIFGHLGNLANEKTAVHSVLRKGLEYLAKTDFSAMEIGRQEIDDNMYALIQEYETQPKADRKAERHEKYIDIQYVHSGEEQIGFALYSPANEVQEDKLAEKDAIFYKTVKNEIALVMPAGSYAIFFPADVHRPCCSSGQAGKVRKVVLKIKVSALA